MSFQSGHRAFDAAVNDPDHGYIGTGNVQSPTQFSAFVRGDQVTECNGYTFEPCKLRDYDLVPFIRRDIPRGLLDTILAMTQLESLIVYQFHHTGQRHLVEHGWIVTGTDHRLRRQLVTGPTWKSRLVIEAAARIVASPSFSQPPVAA